MTTVVRKELIDDINKFLKGTHMGINAMEMLINKCKDDDEKKLKEVLQGIQDMYKDQKSKLEDIIHELEDKPAKTSGLTGEIFGFFDNVKDSLMIRGKEEILNEAIKNVHTGYEMGSRFLEYNNDLTPKSRHIIARMVDENKKALEELKKISL